MSLIPYLFFNGRCEEALDFYQQALGARREMLMRFSDSPQPPGMPLPPDWGAKVMHAQLRLGEMLLFASDGGAPGEARFEGFTLALNLPERDRAQKAFDALGAGGQVRMPMAQTFFSPWFGMVTDRFGVGWMIGVDLGT